MRMQILLAALKPSLANAWREIARDLDFVSVHEGSILETDCDAVVSPANSFGFMKGGIDAVYMDYFGPSIQHKVRQQIYEHHHGELVVGTAAIAETDNNRIPFLIAAPTMRVPMELNASVNPYLAARAVLLLVQQGTFLSGKRTGQPISESIHTIAFPGLGTGVGGISPTACASQVKAAIEHVLLGQNDLPKTMAEASDRHQRLHKYE